MSSLHTPTPEAAASLYQFTSMWKRFLNERPGADTTDRSSLAIRWGESLFPFWNLVFLSEPVSDEREFSAILADAALYLRTKERSGFVCICEEFLTPELQRKLESLTNAHQLSFAVSCYGMEANLDLLREPEHPLLHWERVTTQEALGEYADINSAAYHLGMEAVRDALQGCPIWINEMQTVLGYSNGQPVSTSAAIANEGALFLALVATRPDAQGRGFGEATVRKALYEGQKATGLSRTMLHATEAGFPIYERIGYKKTATIRCYTPLF